MRVNLRQWISKLGVGHRWVAERMQVPTLSENEAHRIRSTKSPHRCSAKRRTKRPNAEGYHMPSGYVRNSTAAEECVVVGSSKARANNEN